MYLMNVPPVAAIHPEWRSCGPSRGYSLPLCFHDSDSELSTTGTPIPEKVQMIIESLRSTQSSLDMGDEIEGNVLSGQDAHPQACKARMGPVVGLKSKSKTPIECRQPDVSSPISSESQGSDSDDSVDRGIEEAILEYLKEKDNHKRKAEPTTNILQPCKIPRTDPAVPDISKQHSDSNKVLTASIQVPKCVKAENHTAPAFTAAKNLLRSKPLFRENPVKKTDSSRGTPTKSVISLNNQKKCSEKTNTLFNKIKLPVAVKVEEDSPESSSDDGIEEAIQRYQLEQKEEKQKGSREASKPLALKEEPDSSSDDGIEEAIRSYQLEQLKEKSVPKPSLPKQKSIGKLPVRPIESTSTEQVKKLKLSRRKKKRPEKRPPLPSPVCILKNRLSDSPKGKGHGVVSSKVETLQEQQPLAALKVNTTAELMCAEAILDISKAVMPEVFNPNVGIVSSSPTQPSSALVPSTCPDDESDDSSVDSEDGIEQEIRKFLEQKAQINKQPPDSVAAVSTAPESANELDKVKSKQSVPQKKVMRLSLTRKRKQREEERRQIPKEPLTDQQMKEDSPLKSPPEHENRSSPSSSPLRIPPHSSAGLDKTEQSGDKSSSLDSDEDLDTAIKDLLKTKKKLKKKTRDMKLKSRKCLKDAEPLSGSTLQTKQKPKPEPVSKGGVSKKVIKSRDDVAEKSKLSKKSISQHKLSNKRKEAGIQASEADQSKGPGGINTPSPDNSRAVVQIKEDSSSVDSDDSIELEIRKFLAEKAMVSTTERPGDVPGNAYVEICNPIPDKDIKLENQLAEIPRQNITALPGRSPVADPESEASQDKEAFPTTHTALPDTPKTVSGPCLSSALSDSPSPLEPADGAGAVRTERKRPSTGSSDYQNVTSEMVRARPLVSPSVAQSRSDSIKWRQSLGLPTTEARGVSLSRTPFHITSPKISEAAAHQRGNADPKPQTPATTCASAKSSRSLAPFHRSSERPALCRSPYSTPLSTAMQPPGRYFMQGLAAGAHWTQHTLPARTESVVHVAKDQCAFVELASNKINHVQFRSKEMSEGKDRRDSPSERERERESMATDEKGMAIGREEEDCVDEKDCEPNERRSPVKEQGFPTLSLSSAIHHGITLSPYIALTTEERRTRFSRMHRAINQQKVKASLYGGAPVHNKVVEPVKRKLQFLPVSRRNEQAFR